VLYGVRRQRGARAQKQAMARAPQAARMEHFQDDRAKKVHGV